MENESHGHLGFDPRADLGRGWPVWGARWVLLAALALASGHAGASERRLIREDFGSDPAGRGWRAWGDPSLFAWDSAAGRLRAVWDSSRPNSYFMLPLETVVGRADDFRVSFDLTLEEIAIGTTEGKPGGFEIAVGFVRFAEASRPGYLRGTGIDSPNLLEWDYFPDAGFGATVAGTIISTNHQWATVFNVPVELAVGVEYRVAMEYRAGETALAMDLIQDGTSISLNPVLLPEEPDFSDFRLDSFAVLSYSDVGQDPEYAGSIRAAGWIDNVELELPPPAIGGFRGGFHDGVWWVRFTGQPGWLYTLMSSSDLRAWRAVGESVVGDGGEQTIADAMPTGDARWYRLRADHP